MPAHISLITLAVAGVPQATAVYEKLLALWGDGGGIGLPD